jgi:cysteine-rich repeat protein
MGLSNTGEKRNSGLIPAGLVMLLVLATPLAYAQEPVCGDGTTTTPPEQCDDGNTTDGDGCSSTCTTEPPVICGDGTTTTPPEQCDDGNTTDGDGCSSTCTTEPPLICGDGTTTTPPEQCDDGNTTDGDGCSSTCQNEPLAPVASAVGITGTPQVGQVLTGTYTYSDAEGDLQGASTFRWLRGDTPIDGATALTYILVAADEGALIRFEVTPVALSGPSPGLAVTSDAVGPVGPIPIIGDFAPVASAVGITGIPQVGQVLTGGYTYTDTEGDPEGASTFRWLRGDTPIDGATAQTYTLGAADRGALVRFEVTPVALSGPSPGLAVTSDAVGPVAPPNAPPTASNVLISGTPQVGQVLAGSYDYADIEGDLQGVSTFRWLYTDGEIHTPIDGATALTYTLVAADEGARIRFEVTPVAQSGRSPGLAASAVVGPIVTPRPDLSTPPRASNVLIAGTPRVGQVLTGSYTYADAEGDLQGASTFRWLRDNVAIAGATARSYALVAADEGTRIRFQITPVAQSGPSPGLAVTSAEVGPITPAPNDRPTASDLELISLTGTPDLLTVNGQLTYTITVRNNGPAAATDVHVIDALPATPVAAGGPADSSQGQCRGTSSSGPQPQALTVDCDLETLAPGAEATVTINVMPTVTGDLINTAQVAAFETDPNPANNSKTETTPVRLPDPAEADLAITATVGPRASGPGLTYSLTVTNNGPAMATRVQLTNDLPRDIALEQIIPSKGSCGDTDPVLCAIGALPSDAAATVTIDVIRTEVDPDTLPNRAAVNGDQHDPNTANNFALTSALELPTRQTTCDSTRCRLKITCNGSDLLESNCQNMVTLFVDTRARRLSDERAARPRRVRFAAGIGNVPGDQTENVRLKLTSKGKNLAGTLLRQGKKKVRGVMEIGNHVGGEGIDIIHLTVRLR